MSELFGNLSLVGSSGRFVAVLTKRQLTLERYDGHGIRLDLGAISRLRNIQIARLPSSIVPLGGVATYLGAFVLVAPLGQILAATGVLTVASYFISKRSVLVIETSAGDRHTISGSEGILLRICMMVDKVRHGATIEEAKIGLEDIDREIPPYPSFTEAGGFLPQTKGLLTAPEIDNHENEVESFNFGHTPNEVERRPTPIYSSSPPIAHAVQSQVPIIPQTPPEQTNDYSRTTWGESANLENLNSEVEASAYEKTWGREKPDWYAEREPSRIDSALSEANDSMDLFGAGGIFDADPVSYPAPSPSSSPTNYSTPSTPAPASFNHDVSDSHNDNNQYFNNEISQPVARRPASSSQMIQAANNQFGAPTSPYTPQGLPDPTEEAVRDECKPGLVRQARAQKALAIRENIRVALPEPADMGDFPGIANLATPMLNGRVQVRSKSSERRVSWFESLIRPKAKPIRVRAQTYAAEYGDSDGIISDESSRFQTNQHLRLRSDHTHQADTISNVQEITSAQPSTAKDALSAVVNRVSRGEEHSPRQIHDPNTTLRFNQLQRTTVEDEPVHLRQIRRLD
ncbi:MAG: hypothetical protein HN401_01380 [Euryarchaeota archaeon]|nr:hypothetical protein [Euryarchaeota archaeon]MBT7980078.1 hypothetical protein [Euryarchaeota archaeon]